MRKIHTFKDIPLYINFKDGKMLDTHEPLYVEDKQMTHDTSTSDRLRMYAGLTPNINSDEAALMLEAADVIDRLIEAAKPFADHDWYDAGLEDDNCQLVKHSGMLTVGHWRELRRALGMKR